MTKPPRGTTVSVRYSNDDTRPKRWGVHWNEYKDGFSGRPKQRAKFYATKAEAEQVQQLVMAELAQPTRTPLTAPVPTYRAADSLAALAGYDYTDRKWGHPNYTGWLRHVQEQREGHTLRGYADCVKNWIAPPKGHARYPGLGDLVVSDATCTPKVFVDYLNELHRAGVSLSMRRRIQRTLSAFCSWAKFAGKLTGHNPCFDLGRMIRRKGEEDQQAEPNPLAGDEVTRFFDQLQACEDEAWQVYFLFLLDTGVRVGEAAAVKWTTFDFARKRVRIEASYSDADKADKLPKTHERREVHLTDRLVAALLKWKVTQAERAMKRGQKPPVYALTTTRGARCLPGNEAAVLVRTLRACSISGHTAHDFRDTFATSHLIGNWDRKLAWVSKQLGHKTPRTTETFYYKYRDTSASDSFANEITGWK